MAAVIGTGDLEEASIDRSPQTGTVSSMAGLGSESDDLPALTLVARGLGLFVAEGLSCGFCGWAMRSGPQLLGYVAGNELESRDRAFLLADMFGTALLPCAATLAYLGVRHRALAHAARRVSDVAWRLCPLVLAAFVPLLLNWHLWQGRELSLLVLATLFGLGLQGLARAALSAPSLGLFARWSGRPRATVRAFVTGHAALLARVPTALVVLGAAGYASLFGWATVVSHWNLRTASLDLGLEDNLVYNALHWARPFFKSSPLGGPTASHFGYHATPISYALALIYAIAPRAETLLVVQAVLVGGAAIPLFLYGRRHLGPWAACLLAYVYLLYPPVHGANLYDFHYLPVGVFFLWLSLYALDARRPVLAAVAVLLTLAIREDVAAGLVIIGAYLLLTGQRPTAGLAVATLGATYVVLMKVVIMPLALGGDSSFVWIYRDLLPRGEHGFGGVLKTAIANPAYTLNTLLDRDKLVYVLQIFGPLAFLPLRRPIGFLCCAIGFFFTLLATGYAPPIQTSFQYTAHWTTYLFIAMVSNLVWVGRPRSAHDTQGPVRRRAWLVALSAATLVCSYQFGAVFQRNTIRGGFGPYVFGTSENDRIRRNAVHELLAMVAPTAKIVASEMLVPQVSNRPDAYTLRFGLFDAEYLIFPLPLGGQELENASAALQGGMFGVVDVRDVFVLARRGAGTERNDYVMGRIR